MASEQTFTIDPACPVLPRPDGSVQIGWAPHRAVIVESAGAAPTCALLELLRRLTDELTREQICNLDCASRFHDVGAIEMLLDELMEVGALISRRRSTSSSTPLIRIFGRGPLSDGIDHSLTHMAVRVRRSTLVGNENSWRETDLVVLTDHLAVDSRLTRALNAMAVPHLTVRTRDGVGLIGPMVLPGMTSCLDCADYHRSDRDGHWPAVAAQLVGIVGTATPATVLGTIAVALAQIDTVLSAMRGNTPGTLVTLNATLELDLRTHSLVARHWSPHPLCDCGAYRPQC